MKACEEHINLYPFFIWSIVSIVSSSQAMNPRDEVTLDTIQLTVPLIRRKGRRGKKEKKEEKRTARG